MSTEMAIHIFSMVDHVPVSINAAIAFRLPRNQSPPAMAYTSSITDSPKMIVILVAGHHAGRDLLAHVTHLSVHHEQGVLLNLNAGLESGNLDTHFG